MVGSAARLVVLTALICAGSAACSHGDPADAGDLTEWTGSEPAPALEGLAVRAGKPFTLEGERGKVLVLSFGYTSCLEVCPDTFLKAKALFASLGEAASQVDFLYVTVDPERDTPAVLRTFIASVDRRFEGLYLQGEPLAALLAAYHVTARKRLPDPQGYARRNVDPSAYYTMDHTSGFWVIDQAGRLRIRYGHDATAKALTDGVERLLAPGAIHVEGPEVRILPSHAGAFYARVVNSTGSDDRLTSVDSPDVDDAQLHDVTNEGSITSMREAAHGFAVPAHDVLTLARGGSHVMLFGARPRDDTIPLTLHFERRGALVVDAPVRSALEEKR